MYMLLVDSSSKADGNVSIDQTQLPAACQSAEWKAWDDLYI